MLLAFYVDKETGVQRIRKLYNTELVGKELSSFASIKYYLPGSPKSPIKNKEFIFFSAHLIFERFFRSFCIIHVTGIIFYKYLTDLIMSAP